MDDHINLFRFNQKELISIIDYKENLIKNLQYNQPIYTKLIKDFFDD